MFVRLPAPLAKRLFGRNASITTSAQNGSLLSLYPVICFPEEIEKLEMDFLLLSKTEG
jgi:hypothetical protein